MKRLLLLSLVFLATASHGQTAASRSLAKLLSDCSAALRLLDGEKTIDFIEASTCVGYVQGYRDGVAANVMTGKVCVPPEATAGELAEVIVAYLHDNPGDLHSDRTIGIHAALAASYPCPQ